MKHKPREKQAVGYARQLLLACLVTLLTRLSQAQNTPQVFGRVGCQPNLVGAQSATLTMVISMPVNVPNGSKITVTVPALTKLQEQVDIPCQIKGIVDVSTLCNTNGPRQISLQLPNDVGLFMGSVSSLAFRGVFFAPASTKPTDAFKLEITDPAGTVIATDGGQLFLNDLLPNEMQSTRISQVNSVTVGAPTAVYFSVTSLNPIPATGGVQIKLPKWNPKADALTRESYVLNELSFASDTNELPQRADADAAEGEPDLPIDYNELCSPKRGVSASMECNYYASGAFEYITLTGLFEETREAGDTFQFYVSRLRNPISQAAVPFEVITFESIQEVTPGREPQLNGLIDSGNAMFLAQQAAQIDLAEASVRAEKTTVQEFSTFFVSFKVPVPVQEGCTVTIQLPDDFELKAGDLARVQGWGIFGRKSDLNFGIDESSRIIKIVDQCAYYSGADTAAELEIDMLQNPKLVRTTKSFYISVTDEFNQGVAEIAQRLVYNPTAGLMQDVDLISLGRIRIEEVVDMRLNFRPPHKVAGQTAIKIKMPQQMAFSCNFALTVGLKTAPDCEEVAYNEFRLENPFNQDSFSGDVPISIIFRDRILPGANLMIKGITIQMVQIIQKIDYVVDEIVDPDFEFFAPEQQLFLNSEVSTASEEVYSDTIFSFKHTLANNVPSDAVLLVVLPIQIEVGSAENMVKSCSSGLNLNNQMSCQLLAIEENGILLGHEVWVRGAFPEKGLSRNQEFEFQVKTGIYTPLSMKTTNSFQVVIYDNSMHEINYVKRTLALTMKRGKDIGVVDLIAGNGDVGGFTDHKLVFKAPAPIYSGFIIIVHIPEEVGAPMNQNFACTLSKPLSQVDSECRINGQRVTVVVAFEDTFSAERIPIGQELSIDFSVVQSPGSTKPTSPYEVEIKTGYYQIVAEQHTRGPSVINTTPAVIQNPKFEALDLRQLAITTVTLTWINTQVYPKDLAIRIKYDPLDITPVFQDGQRTVPCVFRQTVIVQCEYPEDEPGMIKITDMLIAKQNPGALLQLTLTNQKIFVIEPSTTKSWQMTTYTDSSTAYSIDKVSDGLSFTFTCILPCLTCLPNDPDYCLSCNQWQNDYLILHEGNCNANCPPETHREAYMCLPCDDKCKTCDQNSGSMCTSCYGGFSPFPFLYGNTCVDECIFGFYGNRADASCQTCVDPCETCTDSADKCLSCKMPSPGEPITKFYFENECLAECPFGWVANEDARSNVCERCSDNCATCFGNKDQCATCHAGMKLNLLDRSCVQECPAGETVQQIDTSIGGEVCTPCDSSCVTCQGSPTFCTSCQNNLSLLPAKGTCKLDCDEDNFTQVSLKGECVGCSASCATCQYFQDNCLSCVPGKKFYANTCVDECPWKDGYQYVENSAGVCIIPGIRCPFGYELTPTGNGCSLKAQICNEPNVLNYDMTSCVPGSDSFVPFPMLIVCFIVTTFVVVTKLKKKETRFVATMIVFWSVIEFAGMILVFYLASKFGIAPVVYMLLFAIALSIATNLFFFVVFQKQIMNDTTFFHWANYNRTTVKVISAIGLAFNFKVYRLLYSKFLGQKRFDAPFADPYKFYTPLNLASFMNLLLVMLLVLVACIFGLYYVSWGYQLCVECLEMVLIEIVMIVLYVVEYWQMRNEGVMKRTPNWKVDAKQVDRLKVKSGYEDELSDDGQDPDAYMIDKGTNQVRKDVKPKALKTIHTMEKVLASLLVKKHAIEGGFANTLQEIEYLHEREIMLRNRRRCMSFRLDRPDFREAWGFYSDEEDMCAQNHISEPGSPRSKEMLQNQNFVRRMQALSSAYHMRDQYDNCYAEARDPSVWPLKNATTANKKLQTNVMELLGVDDLREDTQSAVSLQDAFANDEFEYDPTQTAFLIDNVIARMDSCDDDAYNTNDPLVQRRRGSDLNAENYSTSAAPPRKEPPPKPKKPKRKRKQLTKRRMAELPNFEVSEILGEFEVDEQGSQIILQTANGKLNDKYGRMVNRRGYLVDPAGNVITRGNVFIFYREEIDFDDEIPAPFCFRKTKKNVKFSVINFNAHRRMRRKDKLAMQDEFIEREYQKLKFAARRKGGDIKSQQYSQQELAAMGRNPSEKVHANVSSLRAQRQSSNASRPINQSGIGLLQSESSQIIDPNISNLILQDREGGDYFVPNDDGLNADAFQAKNSTNAKRKPPRNPSSYSRKLTEDDDKFIDDVTAPMKAKTKNELLGSAIAEEIAHSARSHRSRSRSNEKSQKSSRQRQQYHIKDGKMLNVSSQRSLEKRGTTSDQNNSQAEIMALPTAGGEMEDFEQHQPRDLDFDTSKPLALSSSAHLKTKKRSVLNSQHQSRPPHWNQQFYDQDQKTINERKRNVVNDEAFIQKVAEFNNFLSKRKVAASRQHQGQANGLSRAATAGIIDDTFLNPDGSVRHVGLAHKNLNQIYGRVRTKFNQQIRSGSHALKFRPQGSSFRNRIDEPRRVIAGMNFNQRERQLQLEINNLMERDNDDLSLTSVKHKLFQHEAAEHNSAAHSSPIAGGLSASNYRARQTNERIQALKGIYSDYRLDSSGQRQRVQTLSPQHPINTVTFEASKILESTDNRQLVPGRYMDNELRRVQQQATEVRSLIENNSAGTDKGIQETLLNSRDGTWATRPVKTPTSGVTSTNRRTKTPHNILEGRFL